MIILKKPLSNSYIGALSAREAFKNARKYFISLQKRMLASKSLRIFRPNVEEKVKKMMKQPYKGKRLSSQHFTCRAPVSTSKPANS